MTTQEFSNEFDTVLQTIIAQQEEGIQNPLSFDEYDRFRKVPGNIDKSYEKYIGMPYTDLPSPYTENESYATYMENRFLN